MKNVLLLLIFVAVPNMAHAVTKCFDLKNITSACLVGAAAGRIDWWATCYMSGGSAYVYDIVNIDGISECVNSSTTFPQTQRPDLATQRYCWCKMIAPAVSNWVYRTSYSTAGDCAYGCAGACQAAFGASFSSSSAFRNSIFSNLKA